MIVHSVSLRWILFNLFVTAILSAFVAVKGAAAVDLTVLEETKSGSWSAGTMRNDSSGKEFCFAETRGVQATILRVVMYNGTKDWFIEIMNEGWNLRDGNMRFSMEFDDGYTMVFKGNSEGDSLTHDLLDLDFTLAFFGLLMKNKLASLKNSNDGHLDDFSLDGSQDAISKVSDCAGF